MSLVEFFNHIHPCGTKHLLGCVWKIRIGKGMGMKNPFCFLFIDMFELFIKNKNKN